MGIINRRNAVLGWATWQLGKTAAKHKAKQSLKSEDRRSGKGMGAIVGALAAAGGALWFWRRRRSDDESE